MAKLPTLKRPQHMDPLWKTLDARIGGREGLLSAALASSSPKAAELVKILLDKNHENWGTKAMALKAGLTTEEVVVMFEDQKRLESRLALHEALPQVVADAAQDAKASEVPCEHCKTSKMDENGALCYVCGGKGYVRRPGDKEKLAFVGEAAGITGKKSPFVQVNTQVNAGGGLAGVSFGDLMRKATVQVVSQKRIEGENEDPN